MKSQQEPRQHPAGQAEINPALAASPAATKAFRNAVVGERKVGTETRGGRAMGAVPSTSKQQWIHRRNMGQQHFPWCRFLRSMFPRLEKIVWKAWE